MIGAAQDVTIPSGTRYVDLVAEAGDGRFAVDVVATSASSLIVAEGMVRKVYLSGNTSLSVYGETGTYIHYDFYGT